MWWAVVVLFSQLLAMVVSMTVCYFILDWIISWTAFHSWLESRISYPYNITSTYRSSYSRNGRSTHNSTSWPIKYICIWFAIVATLQWVTPIAEHSNHPGLLSNSDCQFDHKPDDWSQRQVWMQYDQDHDSFNRGPEREFNAKTKFPRQVINHSQLRQFAFNEFKLSEQEYCYCYSSFGFVRIDEAGLENGQTSLVRLCCCLLLMCVHKHLTSSLFSCQCTHISGYQLQKYLK